MVTVLKHHGIKGMHWGVRRYQNPDGTLTSAGRKRQSARDNYITRAENSIKNSKKALSKAENEKKLSDKQLYDKNKKTADSLIKEYMDYDEMSKKEAKQQVLSELRQDNKKEIDRSKYNIENKEKAIKQIKSTPLNKMTAVEAQKRMENIALGSAVVGAASGIGISVAMKKVGLTTTGKAVSNAMILGTTGSIVGMINGYSKAQNYYIKKGIKGI